MMRSESTRNISFTPWPVLALDPKCWLPTLIAYLNSPLFTMSHLPLGFVNRYLSIWDVAFISSYDYRRVLWQVHLQLLDPLGDFTPRFEVGDVIHN